MADKQTTVKVSADASGFTSEIDRARKTLSAFEQSQQSAAATTARAQAAIAEATGNGAKTSTRAINSFIQRLSRLSDQAGKSSTDLLRLRAAQMGISDSAEAYIKNIEAAAHGTEAFSLANHGAQREVLVLAHELSQGNYARFGGSLMVLAERTNLLSVAFSGVGVMVASVAAFFGTYALAAARGAAEQKQFNAALELTSNYAGLTADRMADMEAVVSSSAGGGMGQAGEVLRSLAQSGQYTADQMQTLAEVVTRTAALTGEKFQEISKQYDQLAADPAKWAAAHNNAMHMMDVATYQHIEALQKAGDTQQAVSEVLDSALQQVEDSSVEHLSRAASEWTKLKSAVDSFWQSLKRSASGAETIADQIRDLQIRRSDGAASPAYLADIDSQIDALKRLRRTQQQNADQVSAYEQVQQRAVQAEQAVARMRDQTATNAEKRQQELATLARNRQAILAGGGTYSDSQYASDQAAVNSRYKDHSARGGGAENALNARLKSLSDANRAIESEEKRHQEQLKALRSSGALDAESYLSQLHDIQAKAVEQEIALVSQRVDLTAQKKNLSAEQSALDDYKRLVQSRISVDEDYQNALANLQQKRSIDLNRGSASASFALNQQQAGYSNAAATRYMSTSDAQAYDGKLQIAQAYVQKMEALYKTYGLDPSSDQKAYAVKIQQETQYYQDSLEAYTEQNDKRQQYMNSYTDQVHTALATLVNSSQTNAQAMGSAMTTVWDDASNALDKFITTGKGNFDQFVAGIVADLAKIALKQGEQQLLGGVLSLFGSSSVSGFATGGYISGPGSGTSDSIPAMLSDGEFVVNAAATSRYGSLLSAINSGSVAHFATGGAVGRVSSSGSSGSGSNPVSVVVHNNGGGGLSDQDAKDLHRYVQAFVDQRMSYQIRRQGGYAYQMRYGQL